MALTYSVIKHNWNIIHEFKALPKILFSIGRHYTIDQDSYRIDFFGEHSQGSSGKKRRLFSKAEARRLGSEPEPDPQSEQNRGDLSRRLAISTPYLDKKIDALVPTYHCKACVRQSYSRMKIRCYNPGCPGWQRLLPNGVDVNDCGNMDGVLSYKIEVDYIRRKRCLLISRSVIEHRRYWEIWYLGCIDPSYRLQKRLDGGRGVRVLRRTSFDRLGVILTRHEVRQK